MKEKENRLKNQINNPLTSEFLEACRDHLYLCGRKYPAGQVVKLVGNRYRLTAVQRSVLMRGVIPEETAGRRRDKLLDPGEVTGRSLSVDSCNVLAAVGNYLTGRFVYIASDGILRDAAESSGIFRDDIRRRRSVNLMTSALVKLKPRFIHFFIDAPLTHSRDLAGEIRDELSTVNLRASVELVNSADRVLKEAAGTLVSGDSEIIDVRDSVFDLSRYILEKEFKPKLPDLGVMLIKFHPS